MQAYREYPRVVVERCLHAVTVVDVDIHVGDTFGALTEQPTDGQGRSSADIPMTTDVAALAIPGRL